MTLLSDRWIKQHRDFGGVVIEPFNENQLNNVSYDLTLGEHFAFHEGVVQFKDIKANNDNFAMEYHGDSESGGWEIIRVDGGVILHPGERCLAHSREFAGGTVCPNEPDKSITSYLQCTSTAARLGLTACLCAGWGDVGYINRWTFEVVNLSPVDRFLPVGGIIAQLCFEQVGTPERFYGRDQGSYQQGTDIRKVMSNWYSAQMLPKKIKVMP